MKNKFVGFKRIFEIFLALCVFFSLFCVCDVKSYAKDSDIYKYVEESFMAMDEKIDISDYKLTPDAFSDVLVYILKSSPWLFFVDSNFVYSTNSSGNIENIYPQYTMSDEERADAFGFCKGEIEKILFYMPLGMSEFDRVLYLHDYICQNFGYDENYESRDMYGMLKNKRGTCQGYAYLFLELAGKVGLECDVAYSDPMCHIWNIVKIDGEWYYIDLTWDDGDDFYRVSHKKFLFSESEAELLGYYGYKKREDRACNSEKYSGEYLNNISTPMAYFLGEWYFAENSSTVRGVAIYNEETDTAGKVISIDGYWRDENNKMFANCFSSAVSVGGDIYFNTKDKIYKYFGGECVPIYSAPDKEQIYYLTADGKNIYFSFGESEVESVSVDSDGDVDGDAKTNLLDIIKLSMLLEKGDFSGVDNFCADMSGNAKIESEDLDILRSLLVNLQD